MRKRILCGVLAAAMILACWGCVGKEVTIGDFVFRDGALIYLSESGKQKEVIYIPEEIEGQKIEVLGQDIYIGSTRLRSDQCKKIYTPVTITQINANCFEGLRRLEAAFIPSFQAGPENDIGIFSEGKPCAYIPKPYYESGINKNLTTMAPANVAYLYGYEGCPNEGYYFIDNVSETGKLIKPPVDPVREGYIFYGWYREETGRIFDFLNDEIILETDEDGKPVYHENILVAKWVEKYN